MGLTISGLSTEARREVPPVTEEQKVLIRGRVKKLNDWGMLLGVLGLGLQAFGRASVNPLLVLAGAVTLVGGLALYAKMRGRSPWWGALGLLSIFGLAALYFLPKRCHNCGAQVKKKSCEACGAPGPL